MADRQPLGVSGTLLVARMAGWRVALPILKRRMSLDGLVKLCASPRAIGRDPNREGLVVLIGERLWRSAPGPCLERSLAIYRQLGRAGAEPDLWIGVARNGQQLAAHAWVTIDGVDPLGEPDEGSSYQLMARFDSSGVRLEHVVDLPSRG